MSLHASWRSARVLVVDDYAPAANGLADFLRAGGFDVGVAYSARHALSVVGAYRPDAVVMDLLLPDMGGHELARRIRESVEPPPAFVAFTACDTPALLRASEAYGFIAHILKPGDPGAVEQALRRAFETQRA